jgi:SAM-dependent methyltransferase
MSSNAPDTTRREVAEIDKKHLGLLRENVSSFIAAAGKRLDREGLLVLDIAPQAHEGARPHFRLATVETLDIDPQSGATHIADICQDNSGTIADARFDVIVCTEVLEHTLKPFRAVAELHRMLKPGGTVLISVPFNFRIHGPLPDCWRFTEHGLRSLFDAESGFKQLDLTALEDENRFLMPVHYTLTALRA